MGCLKLKIRYVIILHIQRKVVLTLQFFEISYCHNETHYFSNIFLINIIVHYYFLVVYPSVSTSNN